MCAGSKQARGSRDQGSGVGMFVLGGVLVGAVHTAAEQHRDTAQITAALCMLPGPPPAAPSCRSRRRAWEVLIDAPNQLVISQAGLEVLPWPLCELSTHHSSSCCLGQSCSAPCALCRAWCQNHWGGQNRWVAISWALCSPFVTVHAYTHRHSAKQPAGRFRFKQQQ